MSNPLFDEIRCKHFQEPNSWYCSVSALEFVAKLHGLLQPDLFPLQSDPKNQNKGFEELDLLDALGLQGSDGHYDIQSALDLIEEETSQGRFPLVSLLGFEEDLTPSAYHVFVAARQDGQPILIDPADGQDLATTKEDLAKVLKSNSENNPERDTIHIWTVRPKK